MQPLLLIRPLGGTVRLWGRFRAELERWYDVYVYDHQPRLTTEALAEDAVAQLDAFGLESAHVFGLSLGAMAATWLAARHPKRVRKLVLGSTPERGITTPSMSALHALVDGFAPHHEVAEAILSAQFRREYPDAVERIRRKAKSDPVGVAQLLIAAARHDAREVKLQVPTLMLAGSRDKLVPVDDQRALAARWNADLEVIESGHDLSLEAPLETAQRIHFFLR